MKQSRLLSVFLAAVTAALVLSASISAPILCRPFYYAHIGPMGLCEYTGLSREQIIQAFDEMMDFCIGLRDQFSAGILPWSESGASHFADVRALFLLDLTVLAVSAALLVISLLVCRVKKIRPYRFLGRGFGFWGACGLAAATLTVAALASLDFDRAFVVFHALFFPGKTNWLFDWRTDPIILILPQNFFRNCAILIGALMLLLCLGLIGSDFLRHPPHRPRKEA